VLIGFGGKKPRIADSAYVAPNAVVRGDVQIGPGTVVLFGAVVTAEGGAVKIGRDCVIMENAVLRGTPKHALEIGEGVLVGPLSHVTGCVIEDGCFLATGSTVFNGAHLERGVEVRINGVVHVNSHVSANTVVPIGWVALGDPAEAYPPSDHERIWAVQRELDFPGTVWNADRSATSRELTRRYAKALSRHKRDQIVDE
jgi:carbonic anhydrase/acetyltransferase-like protein (isoleucine patch superfamily)